MSASSRAREAATRTRPSSTSVRTGASATTYAALEGDRISVAATESGFTAISRGPSASSASSAMKAKSLAVVVTSIVRARPASAPSASATSTLSAVTRASSSIRWTVASRTMRACRAG